MDSDVSSSTRTISFCESFHFLRFAFAFRSRGKAAESSNALKRLGNGHDEVESFANNPMNTTNSATNTSTCALNHPAVDAEEVAKMRHVKAAARAINCPGQNI